MWGASMRQEAKEVVEAPEAAEGVMGPEGAAGAEGVLREYIQQPNGRAYNHFTVALRNNIQRTSYGRMRRMCTDQL